MQTIFDEDLLLQTGGPRQQLSGRVMRGRGQHSEPPTEHFRTDITAYMYMWAGLFIATKNSLVYFHKAGSYLINGQSTALETFTQFW